jgi:hypothetical protein
MDARGVLVGRAGDAVGLLVGVQVGGRDTAPAFWSKV